MCSSNDFVKQDGFFICQSCGTKYTVEEAKKMMIEGTVKVDNSAQIETYLANARRARKKEDWEEVEKYYNMAEQYQPENIEAVFYSSYAKAKRSLIVNDIFQRQAAFKTFSKTLSIIDDIFDIEKRDELKQTIELISDELFAMCGSEFVYTKTTQNNMTTDDSGKTKLLFHDMNLEFVNTLDEIITKYGEAHKSETVYLYQMILKHLEFNIVAYSSISKRSNYETCKLYAERLKAVDPSVSVADYDALIRERDERIKTANKKFTIGCLITAGVIIGFCIWIIYMFASI